MSESDSEPELVQVADATTAVIADVVEMADLRDFFDRAFSTLPVVLAKQGVAMTGPAFACYHGPPTQRADLEVGFPTDRTAQAEGDVRPSSLPAGRVARVVHRGGYDELGAAWQRLRSWIDEHGLAAGETLWEVYITEPSPDMDPSELRTELNWALARAQGGPIPAHDALGSA
jgi:effector-binding domain-containing protein